MDLTGIIAISGKPGLYKVVTQGKNNVIVESITDQKRFPAYANDRISALEDISIYTYEEDKPLKEIYQAIFDKENGGACISHKESKANLETYLLEVLPNYDQERVYQSDIKKLFQWYNQLQTNKLLKPTVKEEEVKEEEIKKEAKKKAPAKKATTAKATEAKKDKAPKDAADKPKPKAKPKASPKKEEKK